MRPFCRPGGTKSASLLFEPTRNTCAPVRFVSLLALLPLLAVTIPAPAQNASAPSATKLTDLNQIHRRFTNGTVSVVVTLDSPSAPTVKDFQSPARRAALRSQIRQTQQAVLNSLPAGGIKFGFRFDNIAGFSAEVTTNGLQALQAHPGVVTIEPVLELEPHLTQGIALIRGMTYRSSYNGDGLAIAICDTGIDYTHPRLGDGGFPNSKVIGGYDFGDFDADPVPSAQAHGTCCAGIAAGNPGTVGDYIGGVAYNAKLYALKISSGTAGSASTAAMIAAWDWCVTHQHDDPAHPLMVISTSFGGGQYFTACDSVTPAMTTAANNAAAAGITVLASSGNDGYCSAIGWPACISSVISVGAVYDAAFGNYLPCVSSASCAPKIAGGCTTGWYVNDSTAADKVTAYANVASFLTLFAPANQCYTLDIVGASGYSSGDYYSEFGGTSAACPYAAGAAAVLQSAAKALTGNFLSPAQIKDLLLTYGDNVTDTKVAITKPRVNLERAILSLDTNTVAVFTASPTNGARPLTVTFTSLSSGSTNFAWDFGDGKTSTAINPLNTYSNAGVYSVTLTVIGPGGTNSLTKTNYILVTNPPPPVVNFTANTTNGGAPLAVTFANTTTGATNYSWNFGDGKFSLATNPANTFTNAGSYTVTLTAIGLGGTNSLARTNYIVVTNVTPRIVTQPLDQIANTGSNATFVIAATGTPPLTYQWKFNGTNIPGATAAAYTRTNAQLSHMGLYSVVVSNVAGMAASSNATLIVIVSPGIISVVGIPYRQDFDNMGDTGTTTSYGWYVGTGVGAISSTTVTVGNGSVSTRGNYNFGSSGGIDRALGSLAANSTQRDTEARFINLSGLYIGDISITYNGEQWRRGNNGVNNQLVLQYSTTGTNYTALGAAFDFNTPLDSGTASALDGNAPANRVTGIGGTFVPASPIANGQVFYLRWADADDSGADHGMAVDDLLISFTLTNPAPVITVPPQSQSVNLGGSVTFNVSATGVPPLGYQWRFNSSNIANATSTALTLTNVQSADAGDYSVVVTNAGGATTSAVATLTVNLPPLADFTGAPTNGFAPLTVQFTNSSVNATGFAWDFGNGQTSTNAYPLNTYSNAGIYSVTLTAIGAGGTNVLTRTNFVIVTNLPPLASFTGNPTAGFAPLTVTFSNSSTNASSYHWDFGDAHSSTNVNPVNTYSNAGSFNVTLSAIGAGGTNTLTLTNYIVVTNYPPPLANFLADITNGLAPLTVSFTNLSLNATEFAWDFGDGNTGTNVSPINTYSNAGNFSVTLTALGAGGSNALTLTNYIVVTNYPPPLADFVTDTTNGLAPLTVTFSNLSLNATDFAWDFGDNNTSTNVNPSNTYSNAGSFSVTLTAIGAGGTNTLTFTNYIVVTNYPPPLADFLADTTNGLAPLTVSFTNLSLNATEFAWDFGDGNTSTNVNAINTYSNAGGYTVTLTGVGLGGTNTLTLTNYIVVTNYPAPFPNFIADTTNGLSPLSVTFTNWSLNATEFAWEFGDGRTSTNTDPGNIYSNAGTFTVTLTAIGPGGTNSLALTNYIVVTNHPPPLADFTADITYGLAPLTVTFTNLSLNATDFAWSFGDGNTSTNINSANTYSNVGTYAVSLTAIGAGGTNTLTLTNYIVVTNYPPPLADFIADTTNGLAPLAVTFSNLSLNATQFAWDFGDGQTSTNTDPVNIYSNAGTFTVTLTAIGPGGTNSLALTDFIVVTNHPLPTADFIADFTNGLAPHTVTFTNLSLNATEFAWDFGNGNTSTNTSPINTYANAGSFSVTLNAIGAGGTNTLTLTNYIIVTNYPPPLADFLADITNGLTPLTVTFTNLSLNATQFSWDFGDGNTSTNVNSLNIYSNAGSYTVTLTAIGAGGSNTLTLTNYIVVTNYPPPLADFIADTTNGLAPLTVTFTNLSINATGFAWDFGDGNTSTNIDPANTYSNAGSFSVTLTALGAGGTNALTLTNYILVLKPAQLLVSPATLDFGNILTGRLAQASFVISNAGEVTLSATATLSPAPFALVDPASNTVASLVFDVPMLGTTNVVVRFAPDLAGTFSNAVIFVSNGGDSTNALAGTGVGAPLILWPNDPGTGFVFVFDTATGLTYEVQFKDSLDDPVWQTLQTVPGDGAQKFITNSVATPGQRFYRLRVE